ncbi:MAG: arsenate reductase ArsC [Endomicrobiaceae bacterium]|nr:arsenate reductase ArsC [Endomicrobiaceae bacterium]MDD3923052.1 arsenate reductase ArsC [Endomicrobiaceae bacterium]
MNKIKVIFICVHNSARSQMAEAFLKKYGGEKFEVTSAGLEPGMLNPVVVDVMKEIGIDISNNKTKSVFDFYKNGNFFNYVITVCDESQSERCPIFPGVVKQIHWGFTDPSSFEGTFEEKKVKTREVRDEIDTKIKQWLKEIEQ